MKEVEGATFLVSEARNKQCAEEKEGTSTTRENAKISLVRENARFH